MARKTENSLSFKSSPIFIIGEGLTEQYYFLHLRSLYNYRYTIKPYFFGTTSIKEMESKISDVIENDGIAICVFDLDVSRRNQEENSRLVKLRKNYGKKENVIFCDSLPSIEFWFLLHFCYTNKYFNDSKSVERNLRSYISQYKKKKEFLEKVKWVSDLCDDGKLQNAIDRSIKLGEQGESYSNIHKAFKVLDTK